MAFGHMDSLGACQADQLFLMFRHEDVSKSWLGDLALQTEDDINVSNKLLKMLVEFAGTGKPSKDNIWKPAELENLSYAVLDSKEVRMEYPAVFAERMQLVQNMFQIIHKHRNFNMSEHPALVQMQKDKEIFGQEEINKEINSDADWGIQREAVETDVEYVSEAGDKSEAKGGDKPEAEKKANVEDVEDIFSLEKAMEMLNNWEAYASEEVKEIVKGIQKDGSFKVITDTLKNIKIETNKDEL
ncbi:uncharacterized protein LOC111707202 isoform X2 [Eurytemora carolleeae]|uniref:uncharacterized protein LOC111707202 isoform X2 n=1 Tax=Eurytemora carolleeae TaxID=1294199 RepID=UPI000C78C81D|nr:uncharacterized protein LOC111707202 isoform X2 [Eurytemora carolleeae]|eukprot:XP_023336026.1 uncharacterized protein LOC111707202 isoform X2 [Eurytemora affinis]